MIALYVVGAVVGLLVLMALVGLALPRDHVARGSATFTRSPDEVWAALVDLDAHARWRRGVKKIEQISPTSFRETGPHGVILYEVTEDRRPERRITHIADDKLPFGGRWIYELAPANGGTRLTITEEGFVKNPIFRFLSKTVFSPAATIEKVLADLRAHLA
ncbi:MAG TPA: SRPBCC family protein [Kofleriaceae bacterium]